MGPLEHNLNSGTDYYRSFGLRTKAGAVTFAVVEPQRPRGPLLPVLSRLTLMLLFLICQARKDFSQGKSVLFGFSTLSGSGNGDNFSPG